MLLTVQEDIEETCSEANIRYSSRLRVFNARIWRNNPTTGHSSKRLVSIETVSGAENGLFGDATNRSDLIKQHNKTCLSPEFDGPLGQGEDLNLMSV